MKCCAVNSMVLGVTESSNSIVPPVLSDYCIQWTMQNDIVGSFPCEPSNLNDINGWGPVGCNTTFSVPDFIETGNTFGWDSVNNGSGRWYVQVIRPAGNAELPDLGYYSFESFGFPFGPFPIPSTNMNCYVNCYTATFDIDDVSTDCLTAIFVQDALREINIITVIPFDDPSYSTLMLAQLINLGLFEPSATIEVIINSPTNVTLNICTILNLYTAKWGDQFIDKGTFTFTLI